MNNNYEFYIDQLIDKNNEYDLYVLSMSIALADMTRVLQNIERVMEYPDGSGDIAFFHKIGLGFMRESYGLLEEMFKQNGERLAQITSAKLTDDDVSILIDRMTDVRLLLQKIIELMYIILNDFIRTKGLEPI